MARIARMGKNREIQQLKDEQAAKERRLWVNTLRITSVAVVVAGIAAPVAPSVAAAAAPTPAKQS
jgi:hypothetical protein